MSLDNQNNISSFLSFWCLLCRVFSKYDLHQLSLPASFYHPFSFLCPCTCWIQSSYVLSIILNLLILLPGWLSPITWWRHQMETFSALLVLCEGNPAVTGGFPSQRSVTQSFDVFFDLRLNKRLRKQSRRHHMIWDAIALIMTSL